MEENEAIVALTALAQTARLRVFRALFGWLPGGMAISAVIACMIFAAISGSSPATVVAIGSILLPGMVKAGFPMKFGAGVITKILE